MIAQESPLSTIAQEQASNRQQMLEPVTRPRFAVWQYEAPAIVLGCSQRKFEDGARARLGGAAELLLRPSGGGAVLTGPWMVSCSVVLPLDHPWVQGRLPDSYHGLGQTEARVGIAGIAAEARRRQAEAERLRKKEVEATNQKMVEHYSTKSLTAPMVLNSTLPATGEGSKEHWIKMIEAQNKEHHEAPIKKDPRLFVDTLQQIRQGKITSTTQIEDLFAQSAERGSGLTWDDTKQLRQEFVDMRTPEGAKLGQQVDAFLASRKPLIDKSNPMMGKIAFLTLFVLPTVYAFVYRKEEPAPPSDGG